MRTKFVTELQSTHHVACLWRAHRVDPGPLFCPSAHTAVAQYHRRMQSWSGVTRPSLSASSFSVAEEAPEGCLRDIYILSLLGWERTIPSNTAPTAHCRLCARHVWIDETNSFGNSLIFLPLLYLKPLHLQKMLSRNTAIIVLSYAVGPTCFGYVDLCLPLCR